MYYDPSGHFLWLIVIAVIAGVSAINYNKLKEYSEELELTGSEKFWNIVQHAVEYSDIYVYFYQRHLSLLEIKNTLSAKPPRSSCFF